MAGSILNEIKKALGLAEEDTSFDVDVTMHINSALSTLNQLGVGPTSGFTVDDATKTWVDFIGGDDARQNAVKSYIYLRVRLLFDLPATSFHISAMNDQVKEAEWRLMALMDSENWSPSGDPLVLDGGNALGG